MYIFIYTCQQQAVGATHYHSLLIILMLYKKTIYIKYFFFSLFSIEYIQPQNIIKLILKTKNLKNEN